MAEEPAVAKSSPQKIPCIREIYRENRICCALIHRLILREAPSRAAFYGPHEVNAFVRTGN